jgi:phosphatidylserine/phosphatidylglycerophosphate/cardiolipin synthase-like enzyme
MFITGKKLIAAHIVFLLLVIFLLSAGAGDKNAIVGSVNQGSGCPVVVLKNNDFLPALLNAIDEARDEIFISIFSFRAGVHKRSYPDRILAHLGRAVKRGVDVKVVLEITGKTNDELSAQNRKTKKLLEEQGVVVYLDSPKKTTHTKLIVIDQRLVILGSHNWTQSALKYNNEISLLVESQELAREARDYILTIVKDAK